MTPKAFSQFLSEISSHSLHVLNPSIPASDYVPLDLSNTNTALQNIDVSSSEALDVFINNHITSHKARVAFGGYLETRHMYRRSTHFNNFKPVNERNIHLGVDLWIAAETAVYTPLDGEVHSFKNNTMFGDYGPTIILKHEVKGISFYTLYGHLSLASIQNIKVGQRFKRGEHIATLGDASVNGDYPPHLHFQVIRDIQDYTGDYPGVCSKKDLDYYQDNCPNPELILKIKSSTIS